MPDLLALPTLCNYRETRKKEFSILKVNVYLIAKGNLNSIKFNMLQKELKMKFTITNK